MYEYVYVRVSVCGCVHMCAGSMTHGVVIFPQRTIGYLAKLPELVMRNIPLNCWSDQETLKIIQIICLALEEKFCCGQCTHFWHCSSKNWSSTDLVVSPLENSVPNVAMQLPKEENNQ